MNVEVMAQKKPDGRTTHMIRTEVVPAMSRLPQAGSTKKEHEIG